MLSAMRLPLYLVLLSVLLATAEARAQEVRRALFTSGPQATSREPVDTVERLSNAHAGIFFFTELHGMRGRTVTHRWEYEGEVVSEVSVHVKGERWINYSFKQLDPIQVGQWRVSILDDSGNTLRTETLHYFAAPGREPETVESKSAAEEIVSTPSVEVPAPSPALAPEPGETAPSAEPPAPAPPTPSARAPAGPRHPFRARDDPSQVWQDRQK